MGQTAHNRPSLPGVVYTPQWVAERIVRLAISAVEQNLPRILDPACGDGALLCEAFRQLTRRNHTPATVDARLQLAQQCITGVDLDPGAVAAARRNLAACILNGCAVNLTPTATASSLAELTATLAPCIVAADAIVSGRNVAPGAGGGRHLPGKAWQAGGFDAVVANPPYVNIRQLHQTHGAGYVQYLRDHYACASGSFDFYVLFIERAHQLLAAGGYCSVITPARLAEMNYARPCRKLLLSNTLHTIDDLSKIPHVFPGVSVYTHIYLWQKRPPAAAHQTAVTEVDTAGAAANETAKRFIPQRQLTASGFSLNPQAAVLSRVPTAPLSDFATVHCGAAGFSAQLLAEELRDAGSDADSMQFIVSGNIDRYSIQHGDVRFMKRRFRAPVLSRTSSYFNPGRRKLYEEPKIVVAGMTRRLEAAMAATPVAIGVQTYAVKPHTLDPWFVLGLLNSRLISYWFASRFASRRLAGGFLAINKSQLQQIPIATTSEDSHQQGGNGLRGSIAEAARRLNRCINENADAAAVAANEQNLNQLVYQVYKLDTAAITAVESSTLVP